MDIKIRSSYDSFRELRESGSYYVDKTEFLEKYLVKKFDKAVLFARPRRFGKTLTMTMLRDFLDIRQDSRDIFEELKIMGNSAVVDQYMNRYPVIFLSLKEIFGDGYDSIFSVFQNTISNLFKEYTDLLRSDKVDSADKQLFDELRYRKGSEESTIEALALLSRMLFAEYGKHVFVIIDEYDVPMAKAVGKPEYEKVRDMIEHMLSYICKTNENIKAVVLSGCLYTVKNSTYTGVNNIIPYTVLSPNFDDSIGFTNHDVRRLLEDTGLLDQYDTVSTWYDGYLFGRERMYCPWDVLQYVRSVLDGSFSEGMGPENYWVNTSETSLNIIQGFIGKVSGVDENLEQLLAGKTIDCAVDDNLPYHKIHDSGENLWSALLETGYLTKDVTERLPRMPLRIPNREIREVFRREVWEYFKDHIDNSFVYDLEMALWNGDIRKAEDSLGQILEATLSFYHEYHEYSYHLILDGFFTGRGYRVLSETETGYGRSDLIILDSSKKRAMVLELKHVNIESDMISALNAAESQIVEKKYSSMIKYQGYKNIYKYGMAFCGKKVIIGEIC